MKVDRVWILGLMLVKMILGFSKGELKMGLNKVFAKRKLGLGVAALATALTCVTPVAYAQERLTPEQLLQAVNAQGACGPNRTAVSARYAPGGDLAKVVVSCRSVTGMLGGGGLLGGVIATSLLGALAAGGGSNSTPDTQ